MDDKKLAKELLKISKGMLAFQEEQRKKAEKRLWASAGAPCDLLEALMRESKDQLDKYRKTHNFKGMSALNKEQLAIKLSEGIKETMDHTFRLLTEKESFHLKNIRKKGGCLKLEVMDTREVAFLQELGLLFYGKREEEKILFVPKDLLLYLKKLDEKKTSSVISRNSQWIQMSRGLIYYLGWMEVFQIRDIVVPLTGGEISYLDFYSLIEKHAYSWEGVKFSRGVLYGKNVRNLEDLKNEVSHLEKIPYHTFTKEELLKAGEPGYIEIPREMRFLLQLLKRDFMISSSDLEIIARDLNLLMQWNEEPLEIMAYFRNILEIPSEDYYRMIYDAVLQIYPRTRLWVLKGHTQMELEALHEKGNPKRKEKGKVVMLFPEGKSGKSSVIAGRNDRCPCGSGKKYKNCCGSSRPLT